MQLNDNVSVILGRVSKFVHTLVLLSAFVSTAAQGQRMLTSPDGRIALQIWLPKAGTSDVPIWSATFRGKPILNNCRLSLEAVGEGELLAGVRSIAEHHTSKHEKILVLFGKSEYADNRYHEVRFVLENPKRRMVAVVFRCYNDAIAVRYEVPKQTGFDHVTVSEEGTSFAPSGNPKAYVQYLENYKTSHEHAVSPTTLNEITSNALIDMPATFQWSGGAYMAITESAHSAAILE